MGRFLIIVAILATLTAACGSGGGYSSDIPTGTPPIVARVDPTAASIGDEITIFGIGFSSATPKNIVIIGAGSTSATAYNLLADPTGDEVESITATVPIGVTAGSNSIVLVVDGNVSNADVTIDIN